VPSSVTYPRLSPRPTPQRVNWKDSRAAGLVGAWPIMEQGGNVIHDIVHGVECVPKSGSYQWSNPALGTIGWGLELDSNDANQAARTARKTPHLNFLGDMTMSASFYLQSIAIANGHIGSHGGGTENEEDNFTHFFRITTGGDLLYLWEYSTGTNESVTFSSVFAATTLYTIVVTRREVDKACNLWVNGTHHSQQTYSNNPTGGLNGDFAVVGLSSGSGTAPLDGTLMDYKLWNRALSGREAVAECVNPYSLYAPRVRRRVGKAGAPGGNPWYYRQQQAIGAV